MCVFARFYLYYIEFPSFVLMIALAVTTIGGFFFLCHSKIYFAEHTNSMRFENKITNDIFMHSYLYFPSGY